jgi:hypothetical protein
MADIVEGDCVYTVLSIHEPFSHFLFSLWQYMTTNPEQTGRLCQQ